MDHIVDEIQGSLSDGQCHDLAEGILHRARKERTTISTQTSLHTECEYAHPGFCVWTIEGMEKFKIYATPYYDGRRGIAVECRLDDLEVFSTNIDYIGDEVYWVKMSPAVIDQEFITYMDFMNTYGFKQIIPKLIALL